MSQHQDLPADVVGLLKTEPLSRRGFVAATVAGAGYALAAGPVNAEAITTDVTGLKAGMANVKVAGGDMPVYFARPDGVTNPPVVLVAMEIFGLHEYIRDVTRRLAKMGALAIAPDLFFRAGQDLTKIADVKQLMPIVNAKADAELLADLDATAAWATAEVGNAGKLGIVGFCRGGRAVWEYAAHSPALKAGVAFYGSLVDPEPQKAIWPKSPMDLVGQFKAPVLGLYGEADTGIPVAQVEAFKAALVAAKQPSEIVIFPGAPHGFHADYRPSYRKDAADAAWTQMATWFKAKGVLG
jgi:carboxymethylenebutenolidase